MMTPKSALINSCVIALLLLLLVSCADTEPKRPTILDGMEQSKLVAETSNRTIKSVVEENTEISFSVIYTGDLEEILFNSTSHLRALIESYELQLSDPFEVNDNMKGIVLHSYEMLENPLEIAKEISQCEEVLMVEAKNLPENLSPTL